MASDQHFYFKYFQENTYVSKILSKLKCKWVKDFLQKLLSGSKILLTITFEWRMILQNI